MKLVLNPNSKIISNLISSPSMQIELGSVRDTIRICKINIIFRILILSKESIQISFRTIFQLYCFICKHFGSIDTLNMILNKCNQCTVYKISNIKETEIFQFEERNCQFEILSNNKIHVQFLRILLSDFSHTNSMPIWEINSQEMGSHYTKENKQNYTTNSTKNWLDWFLTIKSQLRICSE